MRGFDRGPWPSPFNGGKISLNVEEITRRPPVPSRSLSRDRLLATRPSSSGDRSHRGRRELQGNEERWWLDMAVNVQGYTADALTRDRAISRSSRVFTGQMRYPISRER